MMPTLFSRLKVLIATSPMSATLKPALVLLDFQLGGASGLDAGVTIKASLPSVKTVIVTIHDGPALRAAATANGVDGFLAKTHFRQDFAGELARLFPGGASRIHVRAARACGVPPEVKP